MSLDSLRIGAVSVDLDEISNYYAIHGLGTPTSPARTAVYDIALKRLSAFANRHSIPLTLFAVGTDLERDRSAAALKEMASCGHEVGNHSLDHRYDLSRLSRIDMERQVDLGAAAIERVIGVRPVGFRAPGYVIHDGLVDAIVSSGHRYDSSVFPCPAYFAAKAAAMAFITLRGRRSRSVQDHPRVLSAPTRLYRVGRPYSRPGTLSLVEFPVQVTRGLRLPFIGTALTLAGMNRSRLLTRMIRGEPVVNLELHGIDFLDSTDGLQDLLPHQPDVRIPVATKAEVLGAVVDQIKTYGYEFVTLAEATRRVEGMI